MRTIVVVSDDLDFGHHTSNSTWLDRLGERYTRRADVFAYSPERASLGARDKRGGEQSRRIGTGSPERIGTGLKGWPRGAAGFSERIGTGFSERIGTESFERIGTGSPERIGTGFSERIGTESSERIGTESYERIGTESSERIGTGSFERIGTGSSERIGTGSFERIGTGSSERIGIRSPERIGTGSPERIGTQSSERIGTGSPKRIGTESSERIGTGSSERIGTGSPDRIGTESPNGIRTGSPNRIGTESPDRIGTRSPDNNGTGSPERIGVRSADRIGTGSPDRIGTGSPERIGTGSPDRIGTGSADRIGTGSLERNGTGSPKRIGTGSSERIGTESPDVIGAGSDLNLMSTTPQPHKAILAIAVTPNLLDVARELSNRVILINPDVLRKKDDEIFAWLVKEIEIKFTDISVFPDPNTKMCANSACKCDGIPPALPYWDKVDTANFAEQFSKISDEFVWGPLETASKRAIVLVGDSITQQGCCNPMWCVEPLNPLAGPGWGDLMRMEFKSKNLLVYNRGLSGYNSRWALAGFDWLFPKARPNDPGVELVTMFFGANDAADFKFNPAQHVPLDEYEANLEKMAKKAIVLWGAKRILFISPPPIDRTKYIQWRRQRVEYATLPDEKIVDRSSNMAGMYRDACRRVFMKMSNEYPARVFGFLDSFQALGDEYAEMLSDGLHLNALGNRALADAAFKLFREQWPELLISDAADGTLRKRTKL